MGGELALMSIEKKSRMAIASSICSKTSLVIAFFSFPFLFGPIMGAIHMLFFGSGLDRDSYIVICFLLLILTGYISGIVLGCAARRQIRKSREHMSEERKAAMGIRLGRLGIVLHTAFIIFALYSSIQLVGARERAQRMQCKDNIKAIVQLCRMYAADHGGNFPPSLEALAEAGYPLRKLTRFAYGAGTHKYGLNIVATIDSPADTPLIGDFDSSNHLYKTWNLDEGGNIGYVDGSVRWYKRGFLGITLPGSYSAGSGPLENVSPEDWVRQ